MFSYQSPATYYAATNEHQGKEITNLHIGNIEVTKGKIHQNYE